MVEVSPFAGVEILLGLTADPIHYVISGPVLVSVSWLFSFAAPFMGVLG